MQLREFWVKMDFNGEFQLIRQAALDIQANPDDLVRVAGIVQRIKNWWKAIWNPEFRDKSEQVQEAYSELSSPARDLNKVVEQFGSAVQANDAPQVARLVPALQQATANFAHGLNEMKKKLEAVDVVIPKTYVDSEGNELSGDNHRYVNKGYRKNRELVETLWSNLPQEFRDEVPIGKPSGAPLSSFSWYKQFSPFDVKFSDEVKARTKMKLLQAVSKYLKPEDVEAGYEIFIKNLQKAILEQSILIDVNFPGHSDNVKRRTSNEMYVRVNVGNVPLPVIMSDGTKENVDINVPVVAFHDLKASIVPRHKLTIFFVNGLHLSPESAQKLEAQSLVNETEPDTVRQVELPPVEVTSPVEPIKPETPKESSDGPITHIVKKALLRQRLPLTQCVINVNGQTFHHKVRFAKVLSSALRQEIDAECCVCNAGEDVQVQVKVFGSEFNSLLAVHGIAIDVADQFIQETKVGVDVDIESGLSAFALTESGILDTSLRKVSLDYFGLSGEKHG